MNLARHPLVSLFICVLVYLLVACSPSTPLTDSEQLGQRLFLQACAACHATTGDTVIIGPSLAGISMRAEARTAGMDARAYILQSITDPSAYLNPGFKDVMPKSFGSFFSNEELQQLVDYLMSLK